MTTKILTNMLKDLIPMIEGRWFLGDGGLLGLVRDRSLIPWDNDLDIYLLPGSTINIPNGSKYKIQEYYMDKKFYDSTYPKHKVKNKWTEFLSYKRVLPENRWLNRGQLMKQEKDNYRLEYIDAEFSLPYIDIYHLKMDTSCNYYKIPYWSDRYPTKMYFTPREIDDLQVNTDLGFDVNIPKSPVAILERQYGKSWFVPIEDFKY